VRKYGRETTSILATLTQIYLLESRKICENPTMNVYWTASIHGKLQKYRGDRTQSSDTTINRGDQTKEWTCEVRLIWYERKERSWKLFDLFSNIGIPTSKITSKHLWSIPSVDQSKKGRVILFEMGLLPEEFSAERFVLQLCGKSQQDLPELESKNYWYILLYNILKSITGLLIQTKTNVAPTPHAYPALWAVG